jgi:hypothetical protein
MIRRLLHSDIDKPWWDERIAASSEASWYALSRVLDAAAPGWEALVDDASGAVMPLVHARKWGMRYLYQPFAVQRLGVFAPHPDPSLLGAFLCAVPEQFRLWDIYIGGSAVTGQPKDVRVSERTNMVLPMAADIDAIRTGYSESHRRGLRKWADEGEPQPMGVDAFHTFMSASQQFQQWRVTPRQVETLHRLARLAVDHGDGRIVGIRKGDSWLAAGLFVLWNRRAIFLKGLSSDAGRGTFALHRLMDAMIGEAVGHADRFDMAGGHAAELRRFYAGFGAQPDLYLRAKVNRLPQPMRWYKQRSDGV